MQAIDKNVKRELMRLHKGDSFCEEINPRITFRDVLIALLQGKNIYDTLGVDDSVIREYAFEALCDIIGCDYDFPYELWLYK